MSSPLVRAARVAYNAALDLRYGRLLGGQRPTRFPHLGAKDTANSDYLALDRLFAGRISPDDVLVDVGCGKGRVINWWLRHGYRNKIVGIELDEEVAAETRHRLRKHDNVTVVAGNVLDLVPEDGTLFYLYNPFHADVLERFAERLVALGRRRGGTIRILYNNCKYLAPFARDPLWSLELLDTSITGPYDRAALIEFVG